MSLMTSQNDAIIAQHNASSCWFSLSRREEVTSLLTSLWRRSTRRHDDCDVAGMLTLLIEAERPPSGRLVGPWCGREAGACDEVGLGRCRCCGGLGRRCAAECERCVSASRWSPPCDAVHRPRGTDCRRWLPRHHHHHQQQQDDTHC